MSPNVLFLMMAQKMTRTGKIFLIVLFSIAIVAYLIKCAIGGGDFRVFLEASALFGDKKALYNVWLPAGDGGACLYYYSPMFAFLLLPFSNLPFAVPVFLWLVLNIFLLYRISVLVISYLEVTNSKEKYLILFFSLLLTIRFVEYNIGMSQMTIYLLWSILESLRLFEKEKNIAGGFILGLAINIKILPIVFLPYLIYRGKWKAFLCSIIFIGVFLFLPALYLGWEFNLQLLRDWWAVINPSNSEHLQETDLNMHSLTALIPSLLHESAGDLPLKRNVVNMNIDSAVLMLNIIRAALILFTIYFLRTLPFRKTKSSMHQLWEISYIALIIPLIFPHQPKYSGLLILPAVMYLFAYLIKAYSKGKSGETFHKKIVLFLIVLSFALITLTSDGIIGRDLNRISQHYKTITYGYLIVGIALALSKPGNKTGELQG